VPAWLLILLAMVTIVLSINPASNDYGWFQGLRRPAWADFHVWIPAIWLGIYAFLYASAVAAWTARPDWRLMGGYAVLLLLLEIYPWLMCRTRRPGLGALVCLAAWLFGLLLAVTLLPSLVRSAILLLPLLLWAPVEAWIDWSMVRLNGPEKARFRPGRRIPR
jgi:tryptophan-rich sensory protein